MSDPVEDNLPRCRLGSLDRVLLRLAVQKDVQFRHFGNPTPIDFAVKLDRELHSHSLPPPPSIWRGAYGRGAEGVSPHKPPRPSVPCGSVAPTLSTQITAQTAFAPWPA